MLRAASERRVWRVVLSSTPFLPVASVLLVNFARSLLGHQAQFLSLGFFLGRLWRALRKMMVRMPGIEPHGKPEGFQAAYVRQFRMWLEDGACRGAWTSTMFIFGGNRCQRDGFPRDRSAHGAPHVRNIKTRGSLAGGARYPRSLAGAPGTRSRSRGWKPSRPQGSGAGRRALRSASGHSIRAGSA